jgi:hypothetical protein
VFELPEQTVAGPLMAPGCGGAEPPPTVTFDVLVEEEPHALLAVTVIVPPNAPLTTVIELVEEVPVHPTGNVQV